MKHITFFKSALCPRCHLARRELTRLQSQHPELVIEEIDVLRHPLQTAQQGIRMIPALKAGDQILAMVVPRPAEIRKFVEKVLAV